MAERRADADTHMAGTGEEPQVALDPLEKAHHHLGIAAREPSAGHPSALLRCGAQKGATHEGIGAVRAHDEIECVLETAERLHAARSVHVRDPIIDMSRARFDRPAQEPRVEVGPRHDPHRLAQVQLDHQAARGVEAAVLHPARGKRVVRGTSGEQGQGFPGESPSAGLLPRVRRIEDRNRRALLRELETSHRARGAGSDDCDLHCAARISAGETLDVPSFPTATPAARFESAIAS